MNSQWWYEGLEKSEWSVFVCFCILLISQLFLLSAFSSALPLSISLLLPTLPLALTPPTHPLLCLHPPPPFPSQSRTDRRMTYVGVSLAKALSIHRSRRCLRINTREINKSLILHQTSNFVRPEFDSRCHNILM